MAGITIPRYDEQQVKSVGLATPRAQGASAASFGAGLGAGLERAAQVGAVIAGDMQKQELQTKAYEYRITLDDHENAIKFGDPGDDGSEGFLNIQGAESMQFKDAYLEDYKTKAMEGIPKDIPDHMRVQFEKMAMERYNSLSNEFNRHAIAQESKANDAATGAMQASILRNIGSNAYDDNRFQLELGTLKHVVSEGITKKYGESEEANQIRKSALELAVNDAYSKRLNQILLDDPAKGKQFLDDNTGNNTLTPETVAHYQGIIKPLVANQDGINKAFEFIPRLKAGEPVDKLISEMQKGLSSRPEVFKVAEAQLRAAQSDIKNAEVQGAQTAAMEVQKLIIEAEKGGRKMSPVELLASPAYKKLVALGTPSALTLAAGYSDKTFSENRMVEQQGAQRRREDRMERKYDAAAAKQERTEAAQLEFTRLSLDPDEVANMTPFEIGQKVIELGPSLGGQFRKLHASLASPERLATVKLENKSFNSLMSSMGITDKSKQSQYYTAVQDYLVAQQQEGKRVFNPEQMRKAIVGAFQDVEVATRTKDFFGDGYSDSGTVKKKRIDVQNPAAIVIPKDDLVIVRDFLKSNGFDDTPKNRLRVYDKMLVERGVKNIKSKQTLCRSYGQSVMVLADRARHCQRT